MNNNNQQPPAGEGSADAARYAGPLTEDTIRKAAAWLRSAEYLTKAQISDLRRHGLPDEAAAIKRKLPELEEVIAQLKAALHNSSISRESP